MKYLLIIIVFFYVNILYGQENAINCPVIKSFNFKHDRSIIDTSYLPGFKSIGSPMDSSIEVLLTIIVFDHKNVNKVKIDTLSDNRIINLIAFLQKYYCKNTRVENIIYTENRAYLNEIDLFYKFNIKKDVKNVVPKDTLKNAHSIESLPDLEVLFYGKDNPVIITVPDFSMDRVYCQIHPAMKMIGDSGRYLICPGNIETTVSEIELNIFIKNDDHTMSFVDTRYFRLKKLPEPIAYLGSKKCGEQISIGELKICNYLQIFITDCPFNGLHYSITRYCCTIKYKEGKVKIFNGIGSKLTNEILKSFEKLKPGDRITFSEIYVKPYGSKINASCCETLIGYLSIEIMNPDQPDQQE